MDATFVSPIPCNIRQVQSLQKVSAGSRFTPRLYKPSRHHGICAPKRRGLGSTQMSIPSVPASSSISAPPSTENPNTKLVRVVCKFGGSSLANADRLLEVTKLVKLQISASEKKPVIVLSAMGSSTNELLEAGQNAFLRGVVDTSTVRDRAYHACDDLGLNKADIVDPLLHTLDEILIGVKLIRELSPRTKDYLVSFGERLSVRILAAHLRINEGIPAEHVDAFDAGFITNSNFTRAELKDETYSNVKDYFDRCIGEDRVAVVTGFIAKDEKGNVTTLGRGGSDLTACVIGAALGTTEVQVWKDVDGILSTDPRIVKNATPVPFISFEEAAEMAFFGAKVLHPEAMQPAMRFNVPVRVKNSYNPEHPGTVILQTPNFSKDNPITAITVKSNAQVVDIVSTRMLGASGFLSKVFRAFATHNVSIDVIATSEVSISMTLDDAVCVPETLLSLQNELESVSSVSISENDKAIISLVSDSSRSSTVVGRAVSALDRLGIQVLMISQGASKYNVSLIVDMKQSSQAVKAIHDEFFD